jgi:hypothetical protein
MRIPFQGFKAKFFGMKGVRIWGRFASLLVGLVTLTFGLHGRDGENGQPLMKPNIQRVG